MRLYPGNNVAEKNLLFTPQYFDPEERRFLAERLGSDFTFVDVGANVGGYALFAATLGGPGSRILAVEPQGDIFERLSFNIGQNGLTTVKALELAVPLVLGFHLTRTVLCNLLVGPIHRLGLRLGLL